MSKKAVQILENWESAIQVGRIVYSPGYESKPKSPKPIVWKEIKLVEKEEGKK